MGGYAFEFSEIESKGKEPFLPVTARRMTITPEGIRFILTHEPDLIPDIPVEAIEDRSNTDSLSKTILLVQVVWFCVSCVSRGIQNLPLSLLEVSTVAHAICTLFTYGEGEKDMCIDDNVQSEAEIPPWWNDQALR